MEDSRDLVARIVRISERYLRTDVVYLATTGFWSNLGTTIVSLGSLLLYIVFGNFLPKEVYGTYQYLLSLGAIVGAFTLTGMNASVTRAVAQGYEGSIRRAMRIQLIWNFLPMLASWTVGAYYLHAGNQTLGWGLVLIGVFVPLNNAFNTYGAILQGKQDFRRGFLYSLWWNVPYYACVAIAAIFSKAALILLTANLISQCVGLMIAYRSTLRTYPPGRSEDAGAIRYGGHLSFMGLFNSIVGQADSVLAFHFLGAAQLALYSFATAIPDRIGALFKFIPAAAFPRFAGRTPAEIRVGLARRLALGTVFSLGLAVAYIVIAHLVFALLFPAYLPAVTYSRWYALSLAALMSGVIANALTTAGDIRSLYLFNTFTPATQLLLQVLGVLYFGLAGLITARILGNVFSLLFGAFLYWRLE